MRQRADTAKDVKRESRRAQRSMDREYRDMEREESKLQEDIKRCAAKGEHGSARRLAKELVRLRGAKERTIGMKSAVGAMASRATVRAITGPRPHTRKTVRLAPLPSCHGPRAQTMAASEKVAKSIGSAAKVSSCDAGETAAQAAVTLPFRTQAMAMANAGINPAELHRTMQQFAAQSERMEMTEDMVGDMIDDFDGVEEGEVDECTSRVLAEVGLEISTKVRRATLTAGRPRQRSTPLRAPRRPLAARWEKRRRTVSQRRGRCRRQRRPQRPAPRRKRDRLPRDCTLEPRTDALVTHHGRPSDTAHSSVGMALRVPQLPQPHSSEKERKSRRAEIICSEKWGTLDRTPRVCQSALILPPYAARTERHAIRNHPSASLPWEHMCHCN